MKHVIEGEGCEDCWLKSNIASGRCVPSGANDFTLYGTDANENKIDEKSWKGYIDKK